MPVVLCKTQKKLTTTTKICEKSWFSKDLCRRKFLCILCIHACDRCHVGRRSHERFLCLGALVVSIFLCFNFPLRRRNMVCMHSVRLRCHVRRGGRPRWVDLYQHFCIHRESWLFEFSFRLEKLGLHAPRALPLMSCEKGGHDQDGWIHIEVSVYISF